MRKRVLSDYKKTMEHCKNVSKLACNLLPGNKNLILSSLLHDIGKIKIPLFILNKPGVLCRTEFDLVKKHPQFGADIVKSMGYCAEIADAILHHHECWDGNGYPEGLKGSRIPIFSRVIAVADAYDAMTSDRPYRSALLEEEAVKELEANAGKQFDPDIVEKFLSLYKQENLSGDALRNSLWKRGM